MSASWGFSSEPFVGFPDPGSIFLHRGFQTVCEQLRFWKLNPTPGPFLLVGPPGAGKSTLLSRFLAERDSGQSWTCLSGRRVSSFASLADAWCESLSLEVDASSRGGASEALAGFHLERARGPAPPILLLDDVDRLTDEALVGLTGLLSGMEADAKSAWIVFAARPEFLSRLDQDGLSAVSDAIAFHARLGPMLAGEVGPYIAHTVAAAGHRGPGPFSAEAVDLVAETSRGLPGRIDILCRTALSVAQDRGQRTISRETVSLAVRRCETDFDDLVAGAPHDSADADEPPERPKRRSPPRSKASARGRSRRPPVSPEANEGRRAPPASAEEASRAAAPRLTEIVSAYSSEAAAAAQDGVWPVALTVAPDTGRPRRRVAPHRRSWPHSARFASGLLVGALLGAVAVTLFRAPPEALDNLVAEWLLFSIGEKAGISNVNQGAEVGSEALDTLGPKDRPAGVQARATVVLPDDGDALAPRLLVQHTAGDGDRPIPLEITATPATAGKVAKLGISLTGLPEGAQLSAGRDGGDGIWTLTSEQLPGLALLAPRHFEGKIDLLVSATARDAEGKSATTLATLKVTVAKRLEGAGRSEPELPSNDRGAQDASGPGGWFDRVVEFLSSAAGDREAPKQAKPWRDP